MHFFYNHWCSVDDCLKSWGRKSAVILIIRIDSYFIHVRVEWLETHQNEREARAVSFLMASEASHPLQNGGLLLYSHSVCLSVSLSVCQAPRPQFFIYRLENLYTHSYQPLTDPFFSVFQKKFFSIFFKMGLKWV